MTENEAIKSLKGMFPKGLCEKYEYEMSCEAISALEKQIPKKPVMKNDDGIECDSGMSPYCPTCGIELIDRIPFDNKDFYFHCLNCGQALDWSDNS